MTIFDFVQSAAVIHRIALLILIIGTPIALLMLFRYAAWTIRRVVQYGIMTYSELKAAQLNVAIGAAQLQAAQDSAKQALLERRIALKNGKPAAVPPPVNALRLDQSLLTVTAVNPQNTAELMEDYAKLKMEYRRQQLLAAIDREEGYAPPNR